MGAISPGFQADFVVLDNLTDLNVTDVFYKGKRLNEDAPIRVRPCSRTLKHTVHLDKVKPELFLLPQPHQFYRYYDDAQLPQFFNIRRMVQSLMYEEVKSSNRS